MELPTDDGSSSREQSPEQTATSATWRAKTSAPSRAGSQHASFRRSHNQALPNRPRVIEDMLHEDSLQSLSQLKVYGVPQFKKECQELAKLSNGKSRQVCLMSKLHEDS